MLTPDMKAAMNEMAASMSKMADLLTHIQAEFGKFGLQFISMGLAIMERNKQDISN